MMQTQVERPVYPAESAETWARLRTCCEKGDEEKGKSLLVKMDLPHRLWRLFTTAIEVDRQLGETIESADVRKGEVAGRCREGLRKFVAELFSEPPCDRPGALTGWIPENRIITECYQLGVTPFVPGGWRDSAQESKSPRRRFTSFGPSSPNKR
jgi:hypothetical protein